MSAADTLVAKSQTTFETVLSGTDTLVVRAPALGVEHVRRLICDTTTDSEHIRVSGTPSAVSEVVTDTGESGRNGRREDLCTAAASAWDSLTTHLTTPKTIVAVFVEPYDDNPLQAVREETGNALDRASRERLRAAALDRATREVSEDHERATDAAASDG